MNYLIQNPPRLLRRAFTTISAVAIAAVAFMPGGSQAEIFSNRPMQLYQNPTTLLSNYQSKIRTARWPGWYDRGEYSLISSQPIAKWFADWPSDLNKVRTDVADYVGSAWGAGQVPVLVIYNLYKRDCSSASAGGAPPGDGALSNGNEGPSTAAYMQYINQFQFGLQDARAQAATLMPAIILLEPDSLGLQSAATIDGVAQKGDKEGCADYTQQYATNDPTTIYKPVVFTNALRNAVLARTVQLLAGAGCYDGTTVCASYDSWIKVYLDGTHSNWGGWPSVADGWLVDALIAANIKEAAGIFTNVSNYQMLGDPTSTDSHNGELAYGKWLLARVKAKIGLKYQGNPVWGFLPSNCGNPSGFCGVIPEKGQVIDIARSGAALNLSSGDDQGNGWSGWCDNMKAQVGRTPTLYPYDITGASWVDALLWIKPAGETDGCFGNGPTNHKIARGVPDPSTAVVPAGTFSPDVSCMLISGIQGVDAQGLPILNDCNYVNNYTGTIHPTGLRIAKTTSVAAGNSYDSVLLEWNPVPGACHYWVYARPGSSGTMHRVYQIDGTKRNGPATAAFIASWNAEKWYVAPKVQFAVLTYTCDGAKSDVSKRVTTYEFSM